MAPKGKKGKKQQDDWENELGEDVAQTNGGEKEGEQPDVPQAQEAGEDDMGGGGGGLLAMLKKNKEKRKKKGKQDNDFVEGEDIADLANGEEPATNGDAIANKAPEEATFDDDDVFAGNANKKGKKGPAAAAKAVEEDDDDNDSVASGAVVGSVKSKKEKEKERKEREKQRKREQVSTTRSVVLPSLDVYANQMSFRLQRRKPLHPHPHLHLHQSRKSPNLKRNPSLRKSKLQLRMMARRNRRTRLWLPCRNSKKSLQSDEPRKNDLLPKKLPLRLRNNVSKKKRRRRGRKLKN